ncbi:MAG TPA: replication-relaxation family protein [Acidimicrobiales bacterium]|nr:replication-relaxation family protein [Acidimicrobiales bacterium]
MGVHELALLKTELSDRDLAIVRQVADLRLMTARQIEAVHFGAERHTSPLTAARTCRRVLERLVEQRVLARLQRRIGGVRAGSASFVYALGPLGQRVLHLEGGRRRLGEPSALFVAHTLSIADVVVALTTAATQDRCDVLELEAEPACWRLFGDIGGRQVLRPDLFVSLGVEAYECRWFVEVDRGTESVPAVLRKCRQYVAYYRSGVEQGRHGVFPRVCWLVPDERRVERITDTISGALGSDERLFTVAVVGEVVGTLCGGVA